MSAGMETCGVPFQAEDACASAGPASITVVKSHPSEDKELGMIMESLLAEVTEIVSTTEICKVELKEIGTITTGGLKVKVREFGTTMESFKVDVKEIGTTTDSFEPEVKEIGTTTESFKVEVKEIGTTMDSFKTEVKEIGTTMESFKAEVKEVGTTTDSFKTEVKEIGTITESFKTEVKDVSTSCYVEMKDSESSTAPSCIITVYGFTSKHAKEALAQGYIDNKRIAPEQTTTNDLDYSDAFELSNSDVPFYNDKLCGLGVADYVPANKKYGTELGATKPGVGIKRANPAAGHAFRRKITSTGRKDPRHYDLDYQRTPSVSHDLEESSLQDNHNGNENIETGSHKAQPYLRLGLSKRARTRKPLHEHVQMICDEPEPEAMETEYEEDEDN